MKTKINLRIDSYVKRKLEKYANIEQRTFSEYLRRLLESHVGIEHDDDYDEIQYEKILANIGKIPYEKLYGFTCLVAWLFSKPIVSDKRALEAIKYKVERVIKDSSFSEELKMEFLKVLNDINRFLIEPEYEDKQLYFSEGNHRLSFNYDLLISEILSKN